MCRHLMTRSDFMISSDTAKPARLTSIQSSWLHPLTLFVICSPRIPSSEVHVYCSYLYQLCTIHSLNIWPCHLSSLPALQSAKVYTVIVGLLLGLLATDVWCLVARKLHPACHLLLLFDRCRWIVTCSMWYGASLVMEARCKTISR